jgi:AcrR family transcriptional regulator
MARDSCADRVFQPEIGANGANPFEHGMTSARKSAPPRKKKAVTLATGTQRLLDAAIELFARNGFEAVSVRDVADHAGVSFALIRASYGSKDGLREAAEKAVFDELFPLWVFAGSASSEEEILAYLRDQTEAINRFRKHIVFIRRSILEQRPAANVFLKRVITHLKQYGGYHLAKDYPNEKWLFDPIRSMIMRFGYMLIAPNILAISGVDMMNMKTIERINVEESRYWKLIEMGLAQEKREKSNARKT